MVHLWALYSWIVDIQVGVQKNKQVVCPAVANHGQFSTAPRTAIFDTLAPPRSAHSLLMRGTVAIVHAQMTSPRWTSDFPSATAPSGWTGSLWFTNLALATALLAR